MVYVLFTVGLVVLYLGVWWLRARRDHRRREERARLDQIVTDNLAAFGIPPRVSRYWPPDVKRAVLAQKETQSL